MIGVDAADVLYIGITKLHEPAHGLPAARAGQTVNEQRRVKIRDQQPGRES